MEDERATRLLRSEDHRSTWGAPRPLLSYQFQMESFLR
jgi:hypothetical protein